MIEHAMTRGLLLSAGIDREKHAAALRATATPMGWGLPFAWDAFHKGSPNPPETAYSCTTAIVLSGFLDADLVEQELADVTMAWAQRAWSGFYWYSERESDAIFTSNAAALMAGATFRLAVEHPELFTKTGVCLVAKHADTVMRRLVADVQSGLSWFYSGQSARLAADGCIRGSFCHHAPRNGLMHDGFTLWGIEAYRAAGGRVHIPWTPLEAVRALRGRTDAGAWPAGSAAMRYALAARCALSETVARDLDVTPASERDAAFQTWARSVA